MRYDLVCRVKYRLCGAIVLLKSNDLCQGIGLVKLKDISNVRSAELIYALVVVTNHHYVFIFCAEKSCKFKLCKVCVLILVNANVSELLLIILPDLCIATKEEYRLHDDVVIVNGVASAKLFLISSINSRDKAQTEFRAHLFGVFLCCDKALLRFTYFGCHHLYGECFLVKVKLSYNGNECLFCILCIVNGKACIISYAVSVSAEYPHTYRVEGA